MSFKATFYNFVKPVNSTLLPTGSGVEFDCVINTESTITNPAIELVLPEGSTIYNRNYVHIPAWSRYYWISEWRYADRKWIAYCHVDVLGSFKTQIGVLSPYVLRSASSYDGNIQDNYYPVKTEWQTSNVDGVSPWEYGQPTSGCYSVGIVSAGGVTNFWLMSHATLNDMMSFILSDQYASEVITALGIAAYPEAKAIIDPLQYIASVTWIPLPLGKTILTSIKIGYVECPLQVRYANPSVPVSVSLSFSRPLHPLTTARGNYLNTAPYTRLSLYLPPFGVIDVDTTAAQAAGIITANIKVDMSLGNAALEISAGGHMLSRICGRVGMPVQLSQVIAPGYGILSAAGTAAGIAGDIISGNFGGAASAFASGIGNAITGQIPSANTVGSVGSSDALTGTPRLQAIFGIPASDDLSHRGRPLCQVRQISSLSGYILCIDVEVNVGCLGNEHDEIKAFMESGFYYE